MKITKKLDLIGNTPIIKLNLGIKNLNLYAKLESYSLSGSIKDRMTLYMVKQALKQGLLKNNQHVIEASTGNTAISLAALSTIFKYKTIIVMPEDVSPERVKILKAYNAKVILTDKHLGPMGAIKKRNQIAKKHPKAWIPNQFKNPDNVASHFFGIGQEILNQIKNIDYLVHGIGTGGTLMGITQALKRRNSSAKIVAVEPSESAVLSGQKPGHHQIQGIGEGFIPKLVKLDLIDKIVKVSSQQAIIESINLLKKHAVWVGFSSGANIAAVKKISKNLKKPTNILTIFADHGNRYLSLLAN